MSQRSLDLTEDLDTFVEEQVRSGRHQDASDVVREALRRYEAALMAERVEALRTVIREGRDAIARGDFTAVAAPEEADALYARLTHRDQGPRSGTGA